MEECKGKKKKRKDFQRNSLFGKDLKSNTLHQDCIFKGMLHLMYQNEIECYIFVVDCLLTSSEVWKITVLKVFFFRIHNLQTFILWEEHLTTSKSLCNGEFEHRTGFFKMFKYAGVSRGCPGLLKYRDPRSIGTLPRLQKQEECTFMLSSNRHQFLSLCTEREKFYMAVLLSFEVALMSVPAWI